MKAPPVKDRPTCPACSKPLTPRMNRGMATVHLQDNRLPEPEWAGTYRSYGAFCTLNCGALYANEMFKRHGTMFTKAKL